MAGFPLLIDMDTRIPRGDHSWPMIRWRQAGFHRKRHGDNSIIYLWLVVPIIIAAVMSSVFLAYDPSKNGLGAFFMWGMLSFVLVLLTMPIVEIHAQIIQPHTTAWFGEYDKQGKPTGSKKVIPQYVHVFMVPDNGVVTLYIQTALKEADLNNFSGEVESVDADEVRAFVVGTYNQWFEYQDGRRGDIPVIVAETTNGRVIQVAEHWGSRAEMADLHYKLTGFVLGNRPKGGYRTFFDPAANSEGGGSASDDDVI